MPLKHRAASPIVVLSARQNSCTSSCNSVEGSRRLRVNDPHVSLARVLRVRHLIPVMFEWSLELWRRLAEVRVSQTTKGSGKRAPLPKANLLHAMLMMRIPLDCFCRFMVHRNVSVLTNHKTATRPAETCQLRDKVWRGVFGLPR